MDRSRRMSLGPVSRRVSCLAVYCLRRRLCSIHRDKARCECIQLFLSVLVLITDRWVNESMLAVGRSARAFISLSGMAENTTSPSVR